MRHRVFIAINLPAEIKKELSFFREKLPELPARWVKAENLHLTLAFLGYLSDQELLEVLKISKEVAARNSAFSINLNKICYGPPRKMPPRMVWAKGEKSEELRKLQKDLENSILASSITSPDLKARGEMKTKFSASKGIEKPENRAYTPHITLGRIKQWEFRQIEPEEWPEINEDISLSFKVNSIEVMESQLKRGGAEYTILESLPLFITR